MVFIFLVSLVKEKNIYKVSLKTLMNYKNCSGSRFRYDSGHRVVKLIASEHLKRVTERIFTISKCFHRSTQILSIEFSLHKDS
jgi:hypothetical protein